MASITKSKWSWAPWVSTSTKLTEFIEIVNRRLRDLNVKTLEAGDNISLDETASSVTINARRAPLQATQSQRLYRGGSSIITPSGSGGIVAGTGPVGTVNCICWLKGEDLLSTVADGGTFGFWPDRSGYGHSPSMSNPTYYPTFAAGGVSSKPAVYFNAHRNLRFTPSWFTGLSAAEMFIVMKRDASPPSGAAGNQGFFFLSDDSANETEGVPDTSGNIQGLFGTGAGKSAGAAAVGTGRRIYHVSSQSGDWRCYFENTLQYSTASNTVAFSSSVARLGGGFGGGDNPTYFYEGYVAEFVMYNAVNVSTDRANIVNYLLAEYP